MATISARELGRATLARQHLLTPTDRTVAEVISNLLAVQAQEAEPPYTALWTRLRNFERADLTDLFVNRTVVRASGYRQTIQLMTAEDYVALYPIQQALLTRNLHGYLELHPDPADWLPNARRVLRLHEDGYTSPQMRASLDEATPGYLPEAWEGVQMRMAMAAVRIPRKGDESNGPRDLWLAAENYLGRELPESGDVDELVRRYLRAYGPASVHDAQNFLGMSRLREVFDRLAPELESFGTEWGATMYDLPDSPRPDGDTPAPVRLLAAYDHLILGHQDRRRVIQEHYRRPVAKVNAVFDPVFTVDGGVVGMWKPRLSEGVATVLLTLFEAVSDDDMAVVQSEVGRYLEHRWPGMSQAIEIVNWDWS